jgi:putative hemolysin
MTEDNGILQIDLEKLLRDKNPGLHKLLPSLIIRYMKRVVHQDEFNAFLNLARNDYGHDFIRVAIEQFQVRVDSYGGENIPESGGCIVVCNHPLGGLDGIAVMSEVGKRRKDIKALVNDILMNLKNINSLFIPTNKHGKNGIENIRIIDQSYASDDCIIVFPAGLVSRKQNGRIMDLEWKKSFISKAVKYERPVIPLYVDGQNSNFFYNLALFRKKIGIKANVEMFYLVDEAYRQRGKSIRLTVGRPISYTAFTRDHSDQYWAERMKEHVYGLASGKSVF